MTQRIFVSSTYSDLKKYRDPVQQAIRQFGAVDVSMENFGARDERPKDECLRIVKEESDLFVGIYAHRYGFVPPGDAISITESEYNAATEAGLKRFVYIIDEEVPWSPNQIDAGEAAEKLKAFKSRLKLQHICQFFNNEDQLAAKVIADLGRHIARHNLPRAAPGNNNGPGNISAPSTIKEWNTTRYGIYRTNRDVFLTHVLEPSDKPDQEFDIFIYLLRHKSDDLSDVKHAEFFLGPYWGDKVYKVQGGRSIIGIGASAYGTFLCVCRVTFDDNYQIFLNRYIEFEAQTVGR